MSEYAAGEDGEPKDAFAKTFKIIGAPEAKSADETGGQVVCLTDGRR